MIYKVENTLGRGKLIQVYLDGKRIHHTFYLDRRRRIIRKFKTDENGGIVVNEERRDIDREEIKYGHRQKVRVVWI